MPEYTNNILLTGYWPPTNHMLRQFSTNPEQNRGEWRGGNWRGHGFDIHAFFPEFDVPDDEVGGGTLADVGRGDFRVDYQDTRRDWERITAALKPCAIITFSRGWSGNQWELEAFVRNLGSEGPSSSWQWRDDLIEPLQPTPSPPDPTWPEMFRRPSTLPMMEIVNRVNGAGGLDVQAYIDSGTEYAGAFLSEFIGYLGVWYQDEHSAMDATGMCFAAGHIHVGQSVPAADAARATEISLEALVEDVKRKRPTTWISEIMFRVVTEDSVDAGTDSLLTVEIFRGGDHLVTGRLDFRHLDDYERDDDRFYNFVIPDRHLHRTPPLPDGIGRIPSPYPETGMEFSDGLAGHLRCRLRIHNDDMWIKDNVEIWVKEVRLRWSGDSAAWHEDERHRRLGSWGQDVAMSTDGDEGPHTWTLVF